MTTTVKRDKTFTRPVNWIDDIFHKRFPRGDHCAFCVWMEALSLGFALWWVAGSLGTGMCYQNAHAPWLQDAEMGRVCADHLRKLVWKVDPFSGSPHTASITRIRIRRTIRTSARRWILVPHGMDHHLARPCTTRSTPCCLTFRPPQRQISRLDQQVALAPRPCLASPCWYSALALSDVGHFLPHRFWPAFHLAGQFGHAHVGVAALPDG